MMTDSAFMKILTCALDRVDTQEASAKCCLQRVAPVSDMHFNIYRESGFIITCYCDFLRQAARSSTLFD